MSFPSVSHVDALILVSIRDGHITNSSLVTEYRRAVGRASSATRTQIRSEISMALQILVANEFLTDVNDRYSLTRKGRSSLRTLDTFYKGLNLGGTG